MTRPSTHPGRVTLGLLVGPLGGCIFGLMIFLMPSELSHTNFGQLLWISLWVWFSSLPLSVPLGLVVHFSLLKLRLWPVTAYTLVGLLIGPLALMVWLWIAAGSFFVIDSEMAWLGAVTGGLTALIFRLIVHESAAPTPFP